MRTQLPSGLRLAFALSSVVFAIYAVPSILVPKRVADVSGLPGVDLPVYQQAGAFALGYAVALALSLRAVKWEEVRIPVVFSITAAALSAIGAFYYVVLKGVVTPGLVVILVSATYLTVACTYYLWAYTRQQGGSSP